MNPASIISVNHDELLVGVSLSVRLGATDLQRTRFVEQTAVVINYMYSLCIFLCFFVNHNSTIG